MNTFQEVHQIRIALKMKLSKYAWYCGSLCAVSKDSFFIKVTVRDLNDSIRKVIPQVINGVSIKLESL